MGTAVRVGMWMMQTECQLNTHSPSNCIQIISFEGGAIKAIHAQQQMRKKQRHQPNWFFAKFFETFAFAVCNLLLRKSWFQIQKIICEQCKRSSSLCSFLSFSFFLLFVIFCLPTLFENSLWLILFFLAFCVIHFVWQRIVKCNCNCKLFIYLWWTLYLIRNACAEHVFTTKTTRSLHKLNSNVI